MPRTVNCDIQYVHEVSVVSRCEFTVIRCRVNSNNPCTCFSKSMT